MCADLINSVGLGTCSPPRPATHPHSASAAPSVTQRATLAPYWSPSDPLAAVLAAVRALTTPTAAVTMQQRALAHLQR